MSENIWPKYGVSRVSGDTLDLLEDDEVRCLELSVLQCSILRQMTFPWARYPERLVNEFAAYWEIVDQPVAYQEALDELEVLLSGAYDGPKEGCPVGEVYTDRGDGSGYDFTLATLTADDAWHEMDLVNVIGAPSATRVLIHAIFTGSVIGTYCAFREAGNVYTVNVGGGRVQVALAYLEFEAQIEMSGAQHIEYFLSSTATDVYVGVRGYWKPAE